MEKGLKKSISQAVLAIRRAKHILVASHRNPDGDTLGCQLALGLALLSLGKKVILLNPDGVPTRFQFLPGSELILSQTSDIAQVAIAVDCGSKEQLGSLGKNFLKSKTTIQVDHHDFGEPFGDIQVLEEDAAAVGEIVYELICALGAEITPAIASCLLTSIIVDTGSFRFSNIRAKTFEICAQLIKKGVDIKYLIEESYWKKSHSMAKLSSHCLLHAEYSPDGRMAWATVYQKDFGHFKAKLSDVDAVADELRSIEGVKIAALFRETERKNFRISLRSTHGINVAVVAKRFGGGGHHNSAGCSVKGTAKEKNKVLKALQELTG